MIGAKNNRIALPFLILLGTLLFFKTAISDDIVSQKQELERIQGEIDATRKNLDSLQNAEQRVLKEIGNYEQQASANQTVLNRLNRQLRNIRNDLNRSENNLSESEQRFENARNRYISNINFYYMGTRVTDPEFIDELDQEKSTFRKMVYLKALAAYDRKDLSESSEFLDRAESEYQELVGKEKEVGQAQKKKKSEYVILESNKESRERDLSKLRRTKERETDRLLTLSEAARQMEELIARLERNRIDRKGSLAEVDFDYATGNFESYKGGLPAPLKGKVTGGYGWKTERITNLKSFSPFIEITGKENSVVKVVAPGVIAYIGVMRGYGNFMIVEHEDGYYSTYSGVDKVAVGQNQIVKRGDIIGRASSGVVKFELRQGREAVDPMEWLKIDSFK